MARYDIVFPVAFSLACAVQSSQALKNLDVPSVPSCADHPSQDTTVFDTTQVSRKPEVVSGPSLRYPDELRQQRISGGVVYSLIVNAYARADRRSIRVLRSDDLEFERASREYLAEAVFSPGCLNGQAVRVRVRLPIDFKVRG
jgi:protein TonB